MAIFRKGLSLLLPSVSSIRHSMYSINLRLKPSSSSPPKFSIRFKASSRSDDLPVVTRATTCGASFASSYLRSTRHKAASSTWSCFFSSDAFSNESWKKRLEELKFISVFICFLAYSVLNIKSINSS